MTDKPIDRIISSQELVQELSQVEPQKAFKIGFYNLDKMLNGIKEGDLIILSGLTGSGKTELSVSIAKKFIEQNINCLFFSYEISSQELLERFGVPIPVFYLPRIVKSKATSWIEEKIIEARKNFNAKIIFIDHLHYLIDDFTTRSKNTADMLGQICRDFKRIAREQRIIIVLLAHTRKFSTTRPYLQDIKDSSGIIQEADVVMIIHRIGKRRKRITENEDTEEFEVSNKAILYIDKVRRRGGKLGKIGLEFDGKQYYEFG